MWDTVWTAVSAVATALAFLVVAWQSILTRSALSVAHTALTVSEAVALDAARARLDDQAPEVTVVIDDVPWPPLAWSHIGVPVHPWPPGHEWPFPEKEHERIVLQALVWLDNPSSRSVWVTFSGDLVVNRENRFHPAPHIPLEPGQRSGLYLNKDFTIKELAGNYAAREEGHPLPHRVQGTVTVHDDRDNGVTDTWNLELTGCPVEPHETRGSVWRVVGHHVTEGDGSRSLEYIPRPTRRRTYWISRENEIRLPEPRFSSTTPGVQG
ncbi:hypothetical protein C8250_025385 [Streptomyces sp. So13.3]|uniref:hypothetical protein n=1 Tax=Streptomyces TaxID=1883 RepID=UPI001106750D|nr:MULTISPECIES: hypothetical protein [Streptomyces]QNA74777.1 hypothetical protein C8250_025385 [Streptomyces sp. So13.3]